jgi:hypothetical protein
MNMFFDLSLENKIELSYIEAVNKDTQDRQREIQRARNYYNGDQISFLTDRMREYLNLPGNKLDIDDFHLNIIQTIVIAVLDELSVNGFDTSEIADKDGNKNQSAWARTVWDANRMGILQHNIHEAALRDAESFVLVDFEERSKLPRFTWHEKFIDVEAGGDGYGFWFMFEEDDYTQPPRCAVKEWTETSTRNGKPYSYRRRNLYFPDRIEKYYRDPDWKPYVETSEEENGEASSKVWPTPWVDLDGSPIGIPVIRFANFGDTPEAMEALNQQDAVNKVFLDVLAEADGAFKLYFLKGAHATTDGKPLQNDGGNQLQLAPMTVLSTLNTEANLDAIEGGDPTKLMDTLKDIIMIVAQITGTPVSYFTTTKQIAGVDTLKGQDKPLTKKVEKRKDIFGQSWVDVMTMARHVANVFGSAGLDDAVSFYVVWKQVFDLETIKMMRDTLGLPKETLWRLYGLSEEQIQAAKKTDEYRSFEIGLRMQEIELANLEKGMVNQEGNPTNA